MTEQKTVPIPDNVMTTGDLLNALEGAQMPDNSPHPTQQEYEMAKADAMEWQRVQDAKLAARQKANETYAGLKWWQKGTVWFWFVVAAFVTTLVIYGR